MITKEIIEKAQRKIESLFYTQVLNGNQTRIFNDSQLNACGQFLNETSRAQRGIHGTAAAISVLSNSGTASHTSTVPKLFNYLENRVSIERGINNDIDSAILRDEKNIIKVGEILTALSKVNTGLVSKDVYVNSLLLKLNSSKKSGQGWGYFTDSPENNVELLPTIFAVKGKLSVQDIDDDAIQYIASECVKHLRNGSLDETTSAIVVHGVYVLSFYDKNNKANLDFKDLVKKIFASSTLLLNQSSEINLEYWYGDRHEYVRLPWQLYLISLAAKHTPEHFAKITTQERLNEIIDSTSNDAFRYKYSGPFISSRTNSVIYECLEHMKNSLNNKILYEFYHSVDKVRLFLGNSWVTGGIKFLVTLVFFYSLYVWNCNTTQKEKEINIATDVVTFVLFWLFSVGRKKS